MISAMSGWMCTSLPSRRRGATVAVALAEGGRGGEVRQVGNFENRPELLTKLAARLSKGVRRLSFCYEAGPCGYGLHRMLTGCGHDCVVVAPSLIPMKAGDRVKTDRRDALMPAKLHRAGELTAIWIPDAAHEAMRDPCLRRGRLWCAPGRRRAGALQGTPASARFSAAPRADLPRDPRLDVGLSPLVRIDGRRVYTCEAKRRINVVTTGEAVGNDTRVEFGAKPLFLASSGSQGVEEEGVAVGSRAGTQHAIGERNQEGVKGDESFLREAVT